MNTRNTLRLKEQCAIEGCTNPVKVKYLGWCDMHYQRWRRHGDGSWTPTTTHPMAQERTNASVPAD